MRQLNEDEKRITQKNIDRIKEELEFAEYNKAYAELMINTGLEQQYKENKRILTKQLAEINSGIKGDTETLKILESQLINGVEEKVPGTTSPDMVNYDMEE